MKKIFYLGTMALGLTLASCSSDDILVNDGNVLEEDQAFYVSMRISGDVNGGSRAAKTDGTPVGTDFKDGTGNESIIDKAYFVFYDDNGNTVGDVVDLEIAPNAWEANTETGSVEKYYKSVAKVSVTKGEQAPTQVVCYLNPVNAGNLKVNLDEIQTLQLKTAVKGSGDEMRFPMSNSVYYPTSSATTPRIAVPLTMDVNIFKTEAEAEEASADNNYAEIYVERYATKLTFDATKSEQTDFTTGQRVWNADGTESTTRNTISLHFNPQYWAVNAEAKETYVIKSYRKEDVGALAPDKYNYTYAELNPIINKFIADGKAGWTWNSPANFRSYWGMSPAYFTDEYPEVSSDLDMDNHSELQKYISYNDLKPTTDDGKGLGYPVNEVSTQYFKETTVGRVALDSRNPAAAVASVIYVGKYTVKVNGNDVAEDTGFYTYLSGPVPGAAASADNQPYIYFRNTENSLNSEVDNTTSMLKRFLIQCTILYKKVGDNYVPYELGNGTGLNSLLKYLSVSQMTDTERKNYDGDNDTELKLQHNARTLRFKDVPGTGANIYVLTYDGYKQVVETVADEETEMSVLQANIALARNVGFALYYTSGHAYFNIPVRHLGWYRTGNENTQEGAIFDWSKVNVGDFGMVRNHAYTVEIGTITGLASGIGGDDVELVPPASETNYYVSYKVNILRWALVPAQKADL